ncbi:LysM peptidoglycan-binding domain-containing protein [Pseudomonadota bacterium]
MTILKKSKRLHLSPLALGIAALTAAMTVHAEDITYTVQAGDNLWKVADKHLPNGNDWPRIEEYNKLKSRSLEVGQELLIPKEWLKTAAAEQASAEPKTDGEAVPEEEPVIIITGFPATLETVHGKVELVTETSSQTLKSGSTVEENSTIRTGENGNTNIRLTNGSMLVLLPNTELTLGNPTKVKQGRFEYTITSETEKKVIASAAGNVNASAARFRVSSSDEGKQLNIEVVKGSVTIAKDGATRTVGAGIAIHLEADKALGEPRQTPLRPDLTNFAKRTANGNASFAWPAIPDATGYRAQLVSSDRSYVVLREEKLTEPKLAWSNIAPGKYTIRFRSIGDNGLEGIDSELAFTVLKPLQAPYLQTPVDGITLKTATPWIAWSRIPDANHYELQVSKDKTFSENVDEYTHLVNSYYKYRDSLPAGEYYWRVLSVSPSRVKSEYSAARTFTIKAE